MNNFQIAQACRTLQKGGIIAYPSETLPALGCLPYHLHSVKRLAEMKGRNHKQFGFILLSGHFEWLKPFCEPLEQSQIQTITTPHAPNERPTTWLVPKSSQVPEVMSGQFETIAIRLSQMKWIVQLTQRLKSPIISTSCNLHARPTLFRLYQVRKHFNLEDYYPLTHSSQTHQPSKLVELNSLKVIRP